MYEDANYIHSVNMAIRKLDTPIKAVKTVITIVRTQDCEIKYNIKYCLLLFKVQDPNLRQVLIRVFHNFSANCYH